MTYKEMFYKVIDFVRACLKKIGEKLREFYFWMVGVKADWDELRKKR